MSVPPGDPTTTTDVFGKIAVGLDGLVYVADSGNARVQVFTPQGRFVRQFGGFGSGQGQFLFSGDIAVDNAGNVYVGDGQSVTLAKLSLAGRVVWQIGGASGDQDLRGCGDRAHRLIAKWPGTTYSLLRLPVFGPHSEVFALATDGTILKLHITLPGA